MSKITEKELVRRAKEATNAYKIIGDVKIGNVGCALLTEKGNVYVGVNIMADCDIGFCAEHSAIASMVTNKEYKIKDIVTVHRNGLILPPCGRCREMMYQISKQNYNANIVMDRGRVVKLKTLLPEPWQHKRRTLL